MVVEHVVALQQTADANPAGQWAQAGRAPVGVAGVAKGVDSHNSVEVLPARDELGGFLDCEDWRGWGHLEEGVFVAVVGELMTDGDGVYVTIRSILFLFGMLLATASGSFHVTRKDLEFCNCLDAAGMRVELLGKPTCHVTLAASEPWVDEDVVVSSAGVLAHGAFGTWDLEEPGRIAVEMVQNRPFRRQGRVCSTFKLALELEAGLIRVHGGCCILSDGTRELRCRWRTLHADAEIVAVGEGDDDDGWGVGRQATAPGTATRSGLTTTIQAWLLGADTVL
nr:hypothetical protein CFP56_07499 [Quercus suber]